MADCPAPQENAGRIAVLSWFDAFVFDDPPVITCPDCGERSPGLRDVWSAVQWGRQAPEGVRGVRRRRTAMADGDYPEDWEEQGWCCRECAVMAWYGMSRELRREFAAQVAARRAAEANRQVDGQLELP